MLVGEGAVALAIERFSPRTVDEEAAHFARHLVALARPTSVNRAKALLLAASRLGAFGESVGLALTPDVLVRPSVIERFCSPGVSTMSAATRGTLRSNLRAIARCVAPCGPQAPRLSRERAKSPYTRGEIAAYLALADAQPTQARRLRASALVCLGAGTGLLGTDLKAVTGDDVPHARASSSSMCAGGVARAWCRSFGTTTTGLSEPRPSRAAGSSSAAHRRSGAR
jgi:hypothetical protein